MKAKEHQKFMDHLTENFGKNSNRPGKVEYNETSKHYVITNLFFLGQDDCTILTNLCKMFVVSGNICRTFFWFVDFENRNIHIY